MAISAKTITSRLTPITITVGLSLLFALIMLGQLIFGPRQEFNYYDYLHYTYSGRELCPPEYAELDIWINQSTGLSGSGILPAYCTDTKAEPFTLPDEIQMIGK